MLEVKGLRFGYVLGQDIIDNVDFPSAKVNSSPSAVATVAVKRR
mgnify:CR=1 FL=1